MILCLYYWENCTENHNLWQRRRCTPNAESMILADARWDFRLGTNLFLFRLANMANPTLQWNQNCHTSEIHFMTCIQIQIMCPIPVWNWWFSRTRPFAKDGDCQWVGQACQKSALRKIPSSIGSRTFWNWKCTGYAPKAYRKTGYSLGWNLILGQ